MVIKKYALFIAMLGLFIGFSGSAMDNNDPMDIIVAPSAKDLSKSYSQITKSIFFDKPLTQIKACIIDFMTLHVQCEDHPLLRLECYFRDIVKYAVQYKRADVIELCLEDCKYGLSLDQQYDFLENACGDALKYGSIEPYKYLLRQLIHIIGEMPLLQRMSYNFEYDEDCDEIYLEDQKLCFDYWEGGCNESLNGWTSVFGDYWKMTRWLSIQPLQRGNDQLAQLYAFLSLPTTISSLGYKPDVKHLDDDAKSLFNGSYYTKALQDICAWYKKEEQAQRLIIKECAHICGHNAILKALQVIDNQMLFISARGLGKK